MNEFFRKFASKTSRMVGNTWTFVLALTIIATWILTGPIFNFSNTWQLAINTFTTITTFLIVFLIQNTQNRDSRATHLKLDELIKAQKGARNLLVDIEDVADEELEKLHNYYEKLHEKYQKELEIRKSKRQKS